VSFNAAAITLFFLVVAAYPTYVLCRTVRRRIRNWRAARQVLRGFDMDQALERLITKEEDRNGRPDGDLMRLADEVDNGHGDLARWYGDEGQP